MVLDDFGIVHPRHYSGKFKRGDFNKDLIDGITKWRTIAEIF
jgi:hypothetical protein